MASCARSPKAIIFEIQGPPAHSWKREDYLFMVSPLGKGRLDPGRTLTFDVASNRVVNESNR